MKKLLILSLLFVSINLQAKDVKPTKSDLFFTFGTGTMDKDAGSEFGFGVDAIMISYAFSNKVKKSTSSTVLTSSTQNNPSQNGNSCNNPGIAIPPHCTGGGNGSATSSSADSHYNNIQRIENRELFVGFDLLAAIKYKVGPLEEFDGWKMFIGPSFFVKKIHTWSTGTDGITQYDYLKEKKTGFKFNIHRRINSHVGVGLSMSTNMSTMGQLIWKF